MEAVFKIVQPQHGQIQEAPVVMDVRLKLSNGTQIRVLPHITIHGGETEETDLVQIGFITEQEIVSIMTCTMLIKMSAQAA